MKVIDIARQAGVTAETVRYYTREGLLDPARNPDNGYQQYGPRELERLQFIQRARKLGFSVAEVRDILEHADHGDSPCPLVRDLLTQRLPRVRAQIQELQALSLRIEQALDTWKDLPDGTPDGHSICRLIEQFPSDTSSELPS